MAKQKIIPSLWFDYGKVEEAAKFYASVFDNSKVGSVTRASKAGYEITGIPAGDPVTVEFKIEGHTFVGINGGPAFKPNPSISFLVSYKNAEDVDRIWAKLAPGGSPLMDIGRYPHSERYGWIQDKYGFSWQVMALGNQPITQKVIPTLMFTGPLTGQAETAINYYAGIFNDAKVGDIMRYGKGQEPDKPGTVQYSRVILEGQELAAMDSAQPHDFTFNEAVSLMVECSTQKEIDYYWDHLTSGGQESVCGWLKDKFGVSWQVTPEILEKMLRDNDPAKVERVTEAFLKMKKLDINELQRAFKGTAEKMKTAA